MAAARIPYEIILEIVAYLPDIDVRRSFGIYRKLDLAQHEPVISSIVMAVDGAVVNAFERQYVRYKLKNLHEFPKRAAQYVEDDMLEVFMRVHESFVDIRFSIYRLKPKDGENQKEQLDMFYKGDTEDYYWDYVCTEYIRC